MLPSEEAPQGKTLQLEHDHITGLTSCLPFEAGYNLV
jgi:hypothetical protein